MCQLRITLEVLLLTVTFKCFSIGEHQTHTFWVTPNCQQESCQDSTPCHTVDEYYQQNTSIFSTSNATWIFLKGRHFIETSNITIAIINSQNVTWRGDTIKETSLYFVKSRQPLLIENCRDVTLQSLGISILAENAVLNVVNTDSMNMVGIIWQTVFQTDFKIRDLTGSSFINNSKISGLFLVIIQFISNIPVKSQLLITGSEFSSIKGFHIRHTSTSPKNYTTHVIFEKCDFIGNEGLLHVNLIGQVGDFKLIFNNTGFFTSAYHRPHFQSSYVWPVEFIIHCLVYQRSSFSLISIDSSIINSPISITYRYFFTSKTPYNPLDDTYKVPKSAILLQNTTVVNRNGYDWTDIFYIRLQYIYAKDEVPINRTESIKYPILVFRKCTLKLDHYINAILLENFREYYALFDSVVIKSSTGITLSLSNSILHFHNINDITSRTSDSKLNGFKTKYIGIEMNYNSRLLLDDSSSLQMSKEFTNEGGNVFIIPNGFKGASNVWYNEYSNCIMNHIGCDGLCFYQIISENGKLVSEKDIAENGASIFTTGLYLPFEAYQIYNGHLDNCTMETTGGLITMNITDHRRFIHTEITGYADEWQEHDIASPPYFICICNEIDPNKKHLWDCSHYTNYTIFPGQRVSIRAALMGDFKKVIINGTVQITESVEQDTQSVFLGKECKRVFFKSVFVSKEVTISYDFTTFASVTDLEHKVSIVTLPECPLGLQLVTIEQMQGSQCICNNVLKLKGFFCSIANITEIAAFKQSRQSYWLGLQHKQLIFSDFCPPFFCNDNLMGSGTTLKALNSSNQYFCTNLRQGFLCSECPHGYSSVFRGFECTKCHGPWYLITLFYAIAGLSLIALLFLFNLTIVQGIINGISLYANIMYLYDDFLQEHAGEPFYSIISMLNFGSTSGNCFYDGMDEFAKVMFQFVFPIYLFSLVIIIIIGAHKFNFKIFKVAFVAKRAVPVLATLILLTYTSLTGAIITALRYTNVYTHDSPYPSPRWLYQPTLHYFEGKHLSLGLTALVASSIYLIPITIVILLGDLFRRMCIRSLWFSHFLDVFHGAYRWPLGFWLGFRLLIRVAFLMLQIALPMQAFALLVFIVILSYFFVEIHAVKPFRKMLIIGHWPHAASAKGFRKTYRNTVIWFTKIENNETLYLLNLTVISVFVSLNSMPALSKAASILSISVAIIQLGIITVYHGYMYFPIPNCIKERWIKFKELQRVRYDQEIALKALQKQSVKIDDKIEEFPFKHIQTLVIRAQSESDNSDEDETPFSQGASEERDQSEGLLDN